MSSNESSNSSDAGAAALVLEHRKMKFDHTPITTTTEADFSTEWKNLAAICKGRIAILEETAALDAFLKVMERAYSNVEKFDKALFEALYQALGGDNSLEYLDNKKNTFKLKGCDIWFGRQVNRKDCIGMENHGASNNSYFDHLCIAHNPRKGDNQFNDITACVQLKHSESNCRYFTPNTYGSVRTPNLENDHQALGQAILCNLDVWYCLARRGVAVDEIPFTILACRTNHFAESPVVAYCCVDASINIPPHVDDECFTYSVKRFIEFKKQNDAISIAMYFRTMRTGIERALRIAQNHAKNNAHPISLFCRDLKIGSITLPGAMLVGCPIPGAFSTPITISQGELFKCGPYAVQDEGDNGKKLIVSNTFEPKWESAFDNDEVVWFGEGTTRCDGSQYPVLVKVSHPTVHSSLVPQVDCLAALRKLHAHAHNHPALMSSIANVLLGFAEGESGSLITVMKDLSPQGYGRLDHSAFLRGRRMNVLWDGFAALVVNLLLPMADARVNHVDIRVCGNDTYNILSKDNRNGSADGNVELLMIDFESVVSGSATRTSIYVDRPTAMNMDCIPTPRSPHNLLWWQVLWVVNCWISQDQEMGPQSFVKMVFRQPTINRFNKFHRLLGSDRLRDLGTRSRARMNSDAIQYMLNIVSQAFSSYPYDDSAEQS